MGDAEGGARGLDCPEAATPEQSSSALDDIPAAEADVLLSDTTGPPSSGAATSKMTAIVHSEPCKGGRGESVLEPVSEDSEMMFRSFMSRFASEPMGRHPPPLHGLGGGSGREDVPPRGVSARLQTGRLQLLLTPPPARQGAEKKTKTRATTKALPSRLRGEERDSPESQVLWRGEQSGVGTGMAT